ncbi:hypothetical protein D3C72_2144820 [compost metagenome]
MGRVILDRQGRVEVLEGRLVLPGRREEVGQGHENLETRGAGRQVPAFLDEGETLGEAKQGFLVGKVPKGLLPCEEEVVKRLLGGFAEQEVAREHLGVLFATVSEGMLQHLTDPPMQVTSR